MAEMSEHLAIRAFPAFNFTKALQRHQRRANKTFSLKYLGTSPEPIHLLAKR